MMEKLWRYLRLSTIIALVFVLGFLGLAVWAFLVFLDENIWTPRQIILIIAIEAFFLLLAFISYQIGIKRKKAD